MHTLYNGIKKNSCLRRATRLWNDCRCLIRFVSLSVSRISEKVKLLTDYREISRSGSPWPCYRKRSVRFWDESM